MDHLLSKDNLENRPESSPGSVAARLHSRTREGHIGTIPQPGMAAFTPAPLEGWNSRLAAVRVSCLTAVRRGSPDPAVRPTVGLQVVIALTCNQPMIPLPLGAGRGRSGTASPPGQKRVPGAAEQSACVFSDNSVVGHTRINRVVHDGSRETRLRSCRSWT